MSGISESAAIVRNANEVFGQHARAFLGKLASSIPGPDRIGSRLRVGGRANCSFDSIVRC